MTYDLSIHSNPDAQAWSRFFMDTLSKNPALKIDEETMTAWFANAMMAMHDHLTLQGAPINGDHAEAVLESYVMNQGPK